MKLVTEMQQIGILGSILLNICLYFKQYKLNETFARCLNLTLVFTAVSYKLMVLLFLPLLMTRFRIEQQNLKEFRLVDICINQTTHNRKPLKSGKVTFFKAISVFSCHIFNIT